MSLSLLLSSLDQIQGRALSEIGAASAADQLETAKIRYAGKKSEFTALMRSVGQLEVSERPVFGARLNQVKQALAEAFAVAQSRLNSSQLIKSLSERQDVTLPGRNTIQGHRHPIAIVMQEIEDIFLRMGFEIAQGPEVETPWHNFEALNTPADHPARDLQDTFYITEQLLLRTQTSPVQIRTMEQFNPPVRIIAPGRVYRCDALDASHSPMFFQVEGLVVDEGVSFADLRGTIQAFFNRFFGHGWPLRFRPHFFPFTEPSAEVDARCIMCSGRGCRVCKHSGWLEIGGCGMVDPNVFKAVGYDPEKYTGFAFGLGVDRLAMLRFDISEIRWLYESDMRFLRQF